MFLLDYSNIEKIINIENDNGWYVDENDEFQSKNPINKVNEHLSNGWILLSIDARPNDDHTSHIERYILGYPKSNSSK